MSDRRWTAGEDVVRFTRTMTAERMRWYADALETLSHPGDGFVIAPPNIHTHDDVARANGLPARVADGMVSTNWVLSALVDRFGDGALGGATLRTRYVRPVFVDDNIEVVVKVVRVEDDEAHDARRLHLDIACVKGNGEVATGGAASVLLSP